MSNPFDDKIKESLENFEMPYDAGAWAQLAEQLPPAGGAASTGSQFGWKAVAVLALVVTTVATAWYMTDNTEVAEAESASIETIEQVDTKQEAVIEIANVSEEKTSTESLNVQESVKPESELAETAVDENTTESAETKTVESAVISDSDDKSTTETKVVDEKPNQPLKAEVPVTEEKQLVAKFLP
ncbi:MAG: hypothetical protein ACPG5W_08230, partial [Flavobacteriales bacterium]